MTEARENLNNQDRVWGEFQEEEVSDKVRMVKETLQEDFGVEGLSPYEEERLEEIVEQCMIEQRQQIEDVRKELLSVLNIIEIDHEAIARWFLKLYGIRPEEVHRELYVHAYNRADYDIDKDTANTHGLDPPRFKKLASGDVIESRESYFPMSYKIPNGHLQEAENKAADLRESGLITKIIMGEVDEKFKQYLKIIRKKGAIGEDKL